MLFCSINFQELLTGLKICVLGTDPKLLTAATIKTFWVTNCQEHYSDQLFFFLLLFNIFLLSYILMIKVLDLLSLETPNNVTFDFCIVLYRETAVQ